MLIIPSYLHFAMPAAFAAAFFKGVFCQAFLLIVAATFIGLGHFFADPVFA